MNYNGILCIDKPGDHTSFDVIARVRGILHTRKVGHAGTLDPMATGVLPVFLGYATRCCDILPTQGKRYTATALLGVDTDTQDITGAVRARSDARPTRAALEEALESFRGGYDQLPPMYSALQVGGRRLYDLAREGVEVERETRRVELVKLELLDYDEAAGTFTLDVECSKGTYVRTLCRDIAKRAGALCALSALRRTMAAGFTLADCVSLEELAELSAAERVGERLVPTARVFDALPRIYLSPKQAAMFRNGVKLDIARTKAEICFGSAAVYGHEEGFLGTTVVVEETGEMGGIKLFCER